MIIFYEQLAYTFVMVLKVNDSGVTASHSNNSVLDVMFLKTKIPKVEIIFFSRMYSGQQGDNDL